MLLVPQPIPRLLLLSALLALCADSLLAGPQSQKTVSAIRINLVPDRDSYTEGQNPVLTIALVDAQRRPVRAPKVLEIAVIVAPVSGNRSYRRMTRIERGEVSQKTELEIARSGMTGALRVRATHPELLEGGTVLYVRPRRPPANRPAALPAVSGLATRAGFDAAPAIFSGADVYVEMLHQESLCKPPMLVSPTRPMLADGSDAAEITIVQPVTETTEFYLRTTLGTLDPNPVLIQANRTVGKALLRSDTPGEATVTCVRAVPPVSTGDDVSISVRFKQPVAGFQLRVDPPRMPWVDRAEVVVTLLREDETPVATDEPRSVALHRESGSGDIQPGELEIPAGQFQARAAFTPFQTGPVRIAATTPGFQPAIVALEVTSLPYLMFMLPMLGGICGGLVAWTRPRGAAGGPMPLADRQAAAWWRRLPPGLGVRLGTGLLTGTILHWAFVFELLPLPRTVVMNQFSWFVLPVIGGWLGTKVFEIVLKPVGIPKA